MSEQREQKGKLTKVTGTVSKVRHKVVRGRHEASLQLGSTSVTVTYSEHVPVENGDSVVVSGKVTDAGAIDALVFKNPMRHCNITSGKVLEGKIASLLLFALSGLFAFWVFSSPSLLLTLALPILVIFLLAYKIHSATSLLQKAITFAAEPSSDGVPVTGNT